MMFVRQPLFEGVFPNTPAVARGAALWAPQCARARGGGPPGSFAASGSASYGHGDSEDDDPNEHQNAANGQLLDRTCLGETQTGAFESNQK